MTFPKQISSNQISLAVSYYHESVKLTARSHNRAHLANVLVVCGRLLIVRVEGWDLTYARSAVDMGAILEQLVKNFEEAGSAADGTVEENSFLQFAGMMRAGKAAYDEKLKGVAQQNSVPETSGDQTMSGDYAALDDIFWQELMGEWGTTA
jgi:hypothetical protein